MKKQIHYVVTALCALALCLGLAPALTSSAHAADSQAFQPGKVVDVVLSTGAGPWGGHVVHLMNGWSTNYGLQDSYLPQVAFGDSYNQDSIMQVNGQTVYCIEPGVNYASGATESPVADADTPQMWQQYSDIMGGTLSAAQLQQYIGLILEYGYTNAIQTTAYTSEAGKVLAGKALATGLTNDNIAEIIATQMLVWETVVGQRGPGFAYIPATDDAQNVTDAEGLDQHILSAQITAWYNTIQTEVKDATVLPSFVGSATQLTWNAQTSTYQATLTDTNDVLGSFPASDFTASPAVNLAIDGDTLTVSTPTLTPAMLDGITVTVKKTVQRQATVIWTNGDSPVSPSEHPTGTDANWQKVVGAGGNVSSALTGSFTLTVPSYTVPVAKQIVDPQGYGISKLDGFSFTLKNDDVASMTESETSNAKGVASFDKLLPGYTYTITEAQIAGYEGKPLFLSDPMTVAIANDGTITEAGNTYAAGSPIPFVNTYNPVLETETAWAGWTTDQGAKKKPGTFQRCGGKNTVKDTVSRTCQSSWSMAVDIPAQGTSKTVDIVMGQNNVIGQLAATDTLGTATIDLATLRGLLNQTAKINTVHFETGTSVKDFQKGPGQFSLTKDVVPVAGSDGSEFELPFTAGQSGATMYAAHFEIGWDANWDYLESWLAQN
ncbi:MAG: Cys-Gln thioester bond-forming surface protein [Bifidobacteriaceae bacterium]|jgi:hypothetical protein|nr:Cys-Gln thioester bond-forming surface protein [Bifidobacteriaceae bacterium]